MRIRFTCLFALCVGLGIAAISAMAQRPSFPPYTAPRTYDGKPDLNGIWQSMTTANWDLLAHSAQAGRVAVLGAEDVMPPGISVVEGNEIPYLPQALEQKRLNFEKRLTDDPELKCYRPGIPRATYLPSPFQIVQSPLAMLFTYQFAQTSRTIYMRDAP